MLLRGNKLKAATAEKLKNYRFDTSTYIQLAPVPAMTAPKSAQASQQTAPKNVWAKKR
jgi:hypothetical protein